MKLRPIDRFFLEQPEPNKSCLLALREHILQYNPDITETRKYGMPCYCYKGKMFCYLWVDKKSKEPYVLMVEGRNIDHPKLQKGNRSRMKVLMVDPKSDLPLDTIDKIFKLAMPLYQ